MCTEGERLAPSFCGTAPTTPSPRGARPNRRGIARLTPDSALNRKRERSSGWINSWSSARACRTHEVSRAVAWRACVYAAAPGVGAPGTWWPSCRVRRSPSPSNRGSRDEVSDQEYRN